MYSQCLVIVESGGLAVTNNTFYSATVQTTYSIVELGPGDNFSEPNHYENNRFIGLGPTSKTFYLDSNYKHIIRGNTGVVESTIANSAANGTVSASALVSSDVATGNWKANGTRVAENRVLEIANGGTGSATQNFVDLSSAQSSIDGLKTFVKTLSVTYGGGPSFVGTTGLGGDYLRGLVGTDQDFAITTQSSRIDIQSSNNKILAINGSGNNVAIGKTTASTKLDVNGTVTATAFAGPLTGAVTGNASTATALATARAIYGNNFDGTAALTQIIASTYGGTGNGFAKFSGPATSEKTFTLPNASATILTDNALVTAAQGGTGAGALTAGSVPYIHEPCPLPMCLDQT